MSVSFNDVWSTYKRASPGNGTSAVPIWELTVKVDGRRFGLVDALGLSWNDTTPMPEELRKQVVAELNRLRQEKRWNERVFNYSQAARALRPAFISMMTSEPWRTPHR